MYIFSDILGQISRRLTMAFSGETVTVKGTLHDLVRIFSKYVNVFYYTYSLFR